MTPVEAAKLIAMLVTAFPDAFRWHDERQQEATCLLYRTCLLDLPYAAGNAGVMQLIATWKPTSARAWPAIAELRGAIATQLHGRSPTSGEAWGELRKLGGWRPREALDRIAAELRTCIESLGWLEWTDVFRGGDSVRCWRVALGENEAADRARFFETYEQLAHRVNADLIIGKLAPAPQVRRLAAPDGIHIRDIVGKLLGNNHASLADPNLNRGADRIVGSDRAGARADDAGNGAAQPNRQPTRPGQHDDG